MDLGSVCPVPVMGASGLRTQLQASAPAQPQLRNTGDVTGGVTSQLSAPFRRAASVGIVRRIKVRSLIR